MNKYYRIPVSYTHLGRLFGMEGLDGFTPSCPMTLETLNNGERAVSYTHLLPRRAEGTRRQGARRRMVGGRPDCEPMPLRAR